MCSINWLLNSLPEFGLLRKAYERYLSSSKLLGSFYLADTDISGNGSKDETCSCFIGRCTHGDLLRPTSSNIPVTCDICAVLIDSNPHYTCRAHNYDVCSRCYSQVSTSAHAQHSLAESQILLYCWK